MELEKERKEQKLLRNLPPIMTQSEAGPLKVSPVSIFAQTPSISLCRSQRAWLQEMSSGLYDDGVVDDTPRRNPDFITVSVGEPVTVETKTVQQRNKEKAQKKKEALAKTAKEQRIRDNELFR